MVSSIRKFWQRLEDAVHPDDAPVLASHREHTFNLDFPPPAFIGDVDNAPVVILMLNGGYDQAITPTEFPTAADRVEYVEWLKGARAEAPRNLSPYYTKQDVFQWVREGKAVIVNAAAYRSAKITNEPWNQKVARHLPSVRAHQKWLLEEALPAAKKGSRCIIAHRWSLWNCAPASIGDAANVYFSRCPASPYLSDDLKEKITDWLRRHS